MSALYECRTQSLVVTVGSVDLDRKTVTGWKSNRLRRLEAPWTVWFLDDGTPLLRNGAGERHPKAVIRAASAVWGEAQRSQV